MYARDPVVSHLLAYNPSGCSTGILGAVDEHPLEAMNGHPLRLWMGNIPAPRTYVRPDVRMRAERVNFVFLTHHHSDSPAAGSICGATDELDVFVSGRLRLQQNKI